MAFLPVVLKMPIQYTLKTLKTKCHSQEIATGQCKDLVSSSFSEGLFSPWHRGRADSGVVTRQDLTVSLMPDLTLASGVGCRTANISSTGGGEQIDFL